MLGSDGVRSAVPCQTLIYCFVIIQKKLCLAMLGLAPLLEARLDWALLGFVLFLQ